MTFGGTHVMLTVKLESQDTVAIQAIQDSQVILDMMLRLVIVGLQAIPVIQDTQAIQDILATVERLVLLVFQVRLEISVPQESLDHLVFLDRLVFQDHLELSENQVTVDILVMMPKQGIAVLQDIQDILVCLDIQECQGTQDQEYLVILDLEFLVSLDIVDIAEQIFSLLVAYLLQEHKRETCGGTYAGLAVI